MIVSAEQRIRTVAALRDAAQQVVLPTFREADLLAVETKSGPYDVVTAADRTAEAKIIAALEPVFAGAVFIGEEAAAADPSLLLQLDSAGLAVVIDPIDGTWNYANGLGTFGMMIAVLAGGSPIFSVLYDPLGDDWIAAVRDGGAWFGRPGRPDQPLSIRENDREPTGIVYREALSQAERTELAPYIGGFPKLDPLRCSCHEYRLLATGVIDFVLTAHNPMPWDHLAGQLIVTELGGLVAPWRPTDSGYPRRLSATRSLAGTALANGASPNAQS